MQDIWDILDEMDVDEAILTSPRRDKGLNKPPIPYINVDIDVTPSPSFPAQNCVNTYHNGNPEPMMDYIHACTKIAEPHPIVSN